MTKIIIFLVAVVISLTLAGCSLTSPSASVSPSVQGSSTAKVTGDLVKNAYIKGPENAQVTIVEFSDFQCPACAYAYTQVKQLLENYPNDVRLAYRHFPLSYHQFAKEAAYSAEAAGKQGKFWEMYDLIFSNQKNLSPQQFEEYAKQLNLDMEKFRADKSSSEIADKVSVDLADASNLQLQGTPSLFINGQLFDQSATFENLSGKVKTILGK